MIKIAIIVGSTRPGRNGEAVAKCVYEVAKKRSDAEFEWNNKAAGFVSYGGAGGARAVEQLRLVLAEVQIATVRNQVLLSMFTDFENFSVFKPGPQQKTSVNAMLDQLIAWGGALMTLREPVLNGVL
jgi:NAD(P)H-dependent FMN reductase